MVPQDLLLPALIAVVIANIVLIIAALILAARRRRQAAAVPAPVVASTSAATARPAGFGAAGLPRMVEPAPATGTYTDALTGLLLPVPFARLVADEDARIQRYRRTATIVMVEVEGLDKLVDRLGDTAVDRLIPAVADAIQRNARASDHVARLESGRFGILMPETDEVQAINYIERVRKACDLWLESGAVSLRLAIGWASASESSLASAQALATDRMFAETRRGSTASPAGPDAGAGPSVGMEPAFGN
jgi:diguanylate cyclase (GGDEF)-like protein